jgi:glycogen phosphorylase
MGSNQTKVVANRPSVAEIKELIEQYECGPVQLAGTGDALYERHLMFDNVVDPRVVGPRERYEAIARSARDILSQRWLRTDQTYERVNPKRIYYLSMEFLIGRSLANNLMNLLLEPVARHFARDVGLDWLAVLEQEPDDAAPRDGLWAAL